MTTDPDLARRRELNRHRGGAPKLAGQARNGAKSGHPILFGEPQPAVELGAMPQGGGYPQGLIEFAGKVMGVTDHAAVVHLCSGSVRAPLSFDLRPDSEAACIADVRELPIGTGLVRFVMVDPPYSPEHAEELWGVGRQYPTPAAIFREVARILAPGGRAAFLHFQVPKLVPGLERIGTYGVMTGPGYRIRALTIVERVVEHEQLAL